MVDEMNIAIIRKNYDPHGGGAEKYAHNIVEGLLKKGHSVTVFGEKFKGETSEKFKWVRVPRSPIPSLCRTTAFHRAVQKTIDKASFDIVYSLSRTFPSDIFRVTEQLHIEWLPVNYSPAARLNPRHRGILKLEEKIFSGDNTRFVVTNSELVKKQVIKNYSYPSEKINVIRNGIDKNKFCPPAPAERKSLREKFAIPEDCLLLLFVAGNFKIKGLESAIRSIAMLDESLRKKVRLMVVGGDKPAPFRQLAAKLGIADQIEFAGGSKEMRDFYAASDLLFYPSLYEPFANVCLEACSCGLPVLTTRLNGSSELVESGKNGYLVDNADDLENMSSFISEFASLPPEARICFSEKAFESTESYSWEGHVDGLEKLFYKCIEQKGS